MRASISLLLGAAAIAASTPSSAPLARWSADGHLTIAAIAWEHMTPIVRARAVTLLRNGPALAHLADLQSADATLQMDDRRIFVQIATWADRIKSANTPFHVYDHPTWHYADYFWRDVDGHVESMPGLGPDPENALECLERMAAALRSAPADTTRAIALAWIVHLVGDIHQPLHLSSRVTPDLPGGDKGGNSFHLEGRPANLHAYWDGALSFEELPSGGADADARPDLFAALVQQRIPYDSVPARLLSTSFDVWGRESLDLAQHDLYPPTLLAGAAPSAAYQQHTIDVAEQRIALAGYRLATLLNAALGSEPHD